MYGLHEMVVQRFRNGQKKSVIRDASVTKHVLHAGGSGCVTETITSRTRSDQHGGHVTAV